MKRVLHLLSFATSSAPLMLGQVLWRPHVVLVVAPALVCAPMAWLTARLSGAQAWLHIQDFEVDVAFGMGDLQGGWLKRVAVGIERWILRRFDVISTISRPMLRTLATKQVSAERVVLFPNWVNIQEIKPLEGESAYRTRLGLSRDAKVFLFSGSLGAKQDLDIIPKAAERLKHRRDIVFVVAGEGAMKAQMNHAAERLDNVISLPLQPRDDLSEFLGLACAHLLPQARQAEDLVLPSKLTGMLSSGRPVIATCSSESELGRTVQQCGLVVPSGDVERLCEAVLRLADDPELVASLGARARAHAEEFLSLDRVMGRFQSHLMKAVGSQGPWPLDSSTEPVAGVGGGDE